MDIILCTDQNYLLPAQTTLCSVCINNKEDDLSFHVITDKASLNSVAVLKNEARKWNKSVFFYVIDDEKCKCLPFGRSDQPNHASIASYYRLFLSSLLPSYVEKAIYLDCDIIVRHSLSQLWDFDIVTCAIAGVDDMTNMDSAKYNTLRYYPKEGYFNAGVLLVNLKYWRENNLEERFLSYAKEYPERIIFHDQDIMNFTLRKEKLRLPFTYNVQDGFLYDTIHFLMWPFENEFNEAITDPCIVHYSIRFKPWHKDCMHPWRDEYLKYVKLAGLDIDSFPQRKEHLNLYQRLRPLLVKFGFLSPLLTFNSKIKPLS